MTSMLMPGAALFYLIYILTTDFAIIRQHMEMISDHMARIESSFTSVAGNMDSVQRTLVVLNDNIAIMPDMNDSIARMDASLLARAAI